MRRIFEPEYVAPPTDGISISEGDFAAFRDIQHAIEIHLNDN